MDATKRTSPDESSTDTAMGRRAFFSRALLAAGAVVTLTGLTGCPGGDQDEDGEDEDDD